jgi:cytochrome c6
MRAAFLLIIPKGVPLMFKRPIYITAVSLVTFFAPLASYAQPSGTDVYTTKCQMCHGATGLGDTPAGKPMKVRPFNAPDVLKESDADLIAIIKNGKNKMPAFAGKLTDAQIADSVAHIHSLQK